MLAVNDEALRSPPAAAAASSAWRTPRHHPALGDTEVHVLMASVAAHAPHRGALEELLSTSERERADRFVFARDRTQYVVAHGLLRTVLARYLDARPTALQFDTGTYGKPHLVGADGQGELAFNLSHAADLVLIAVARRRAVGVDVERWVPEIEHEEVAHRFFSPVERAELRSLPPDGKVPGFFACWTRKEAYIKATGLGVSHGLDYFDVSLTPGAPARLLDDRLAPGSSGMWTLHDLAPAPGYSGAVVGEGCGWRLEQLVLAPPTPAGRDTASPMVTGHNTSPPVNRK